ncbi:MAG: hypothetical protein R3310_06955, partial [Candidatus Competibacteraceae bacterium]|nr:hypothetical protein [Candidatus Competibacteraceae bacterium]
MIPERTTTQIGRLRIRGSDLQPAVRQTVATQLAGAELSPPGLPPAAILIVRRLADPLPHQIGSRRWRPHPAWEQAVRTRLEDCWHQAARPARGPVPAAAEAVLFADDSELLACLALDMALGRHRQCWWWQTILTHLPSSSLVALLHKHARELPAVLTRLWRWQRAEAVIATLDRDQVAVLWQALTQAHPLNPALPPLLAEPLTGGPSGSPAHLPAEPGWSYSTAGTVFQRPPPWLPWLPQPSPSLSAEQLCLLGVGLALHHTPARACSALFAVEVSGWWRDQRRGKDPKEPGGEA